MVFQVGLIEAHFSFTQNDAVKSNESSLLRLISQFHSLYLGCNMTRNKSLVAIISLGLYSDQLLVVS